MTTPAAAPPPRTRGLLIAVVSAATFGASGPFAKALLDAGWSPAAAVLVRIGGAALVLAIPTLIALGRRWPTARATRMVVAYGVVAVAGAQVCFFNAMQYLPVGVALLLEYLAPVLMVAAAWLRSSRAPGPRTLGGTVLAVIGLVLVLDIGGAADVHPLGVLWGLGAAGCLSVYFVLSARTDPAVPPVALAGGGLAVGAATIVVLGLAGVLPLRATSAAVRLLGTTTGWIVPVTVLVLVSTVAAYLTGILAAGRLGSRVASFVGLTEVLFAVLFAWLLLGELLVAVQLVGGLSILAGVALVNSDRVEAPVLPEPVTTHDAYGPDTREWTGTDATVRA